MTEPLSVFIARCRTALDEYSRLRCLGVSHDGAHKLSGLLEAVQDRPADKEPVDVRQRQVPTEKD